MSSHFKPQLKAEVYLNFPWRGATFIWQGLLTHVSTRSYKVHQEFTSQFTAGALSAEINLCDGAPRRDEDQAKEGEILKSQPDSRGQNETHLVCGSNSPGDWPD